MDYISLIDTTNSPLWLLSLLSLLAVGIPFFVLFIIGLKMLISNLKSIGNAAKITLLALWFLSLIGLGIIGLRQATQQAYDGDVVSEEFLPVRTGDTLRIGMRANSHYSYSVYRHGGLKIKYNEENEKVIYSNDIRLIVRSSNDSVAKLTVGRKSEGSSFLEAKQRAEAIKYEYSYNNGSLLLDGYFITSLENNYRDQEVELILYLPVGTVLFAEENTYSFHRNNSHYRDILDNGDEAKYLRILDNETECLNCPQMEEETDSINRIENNWEQEVLEDFNTDNPTTKSASEQEETETQTDTITNN
jgi:hypothetical protein